MLPISGTPKPKLPRWLLALYLLLLLAVVAAGGTFGILFGYEYNLPKIQSLEDFHPDVITDIYSDDNKVVGEFAVERRIIVPYEEIPPYMQLAILAAEDDQFYHHGGVNYLSNLRAIYRDVMKMRAAEGASTITQQLARMLLQSYEKTLDRKIKELLITWKIEKQYSKQQILTLYCNLHYMGHGAYGVAAAADTYFGKQLKDLSLEECAMIAGLPRNPGKYSPRLHPQAALTLRNYILDRMVAEHMVPLKLAAEAKARPIALDQHAREGELAPYFVEWVRQSLADKYSTEVIWRKGLRVYTTLNIAMQRAANQALQEGLRSYDKKRGWRGPVDNVLTAQDVDLEAYTRPEWRAPLRPGKIVIGLVHSIEHDGARVRIAQYHALVGPKEISWAQKGSPAQIFKAGDLAYFKIESLDETNRTATVTLEQIPTVEGALITIQNATGEIKAMVGGYDFEASEFNRATQAMRQVGSTFKPVVYSTALENGMSPESTIIDAPISFTDGLGRVWRPANYDGKFKGQISVRQALTESRNVPTIKVASLIGIKNVVVMARRFGLAGTLEPYLPLALGACEATPLEMASAFTVFPNMGMQATPYFIKKIEDYDHTKKEEMLPRMRKVLPPEIAEKMLGILQNVVQNGTATAAKSLGRPVGGKTGTTNDFTDAWFIGFTPSITTAVWVGHDERKTLGNKETGAAVALPIWIRYMEAVLRDSQVEQFSASEMTDQIVSENSEQNLPVRKKLFIEDLPGSTPRPSASSPRAH
jgi:penicillin-binding protein 1A